MKGLCRIGFMGFWALAWMPLLALAPMAREARLEYEAGQMIMLGFRGTAFDMNEPVLRDIVERQIGGVVLYDRDGPTRCAGRNITSPAQLKALTADLQAHRSGEALMLVAVDQEGGWVNALKSQMGFPHTGPAAFTLGLLDEGFCTAYWADQTADTLQSVGINLDLAPVLDVNINPDCPVIGRQERSYSADPYGVVRQGAVVLREFRRAGLLACVKHFPGHGSSRTDSHQGLPDISETWQALELEPYRWLLPTESSDAVMVGHLFNSHWDRNSPASLSRVVIEGVLRKQLGWDGVVITDDLGMEAITEHYDLGTSIQRAVLAGADILMFSNQFHQGYDPQLGQKVMDTLLGLVHAGVLPESRIHESFLRIQRMKQRIHLQLQ